LVELWQLVRTDIDIAAWGLAEDQKGRQLPITHLNANEALIAVPQGDFELDWSERDY
jgi:hypothetical protein